MAAAEGAAAPRLTRRRRRQLVLGGEYGIFLVVVVLLLASADWHEIHTNFANWSIAKGLFPDVITIGLRNTLIFTITGFALGLAGRPGAGADAAVVRRAVPLVRPRLHRGVPRAARHC